MHLLSEEKLRRLEYWETKLTVQNENCAYKLDFPKDITPNQINEHNNKKIRFPTLLGDNPCHKRKQSSGFKTVSWLMKQIHLIISCINSYLDVLMQGSKF